MSADSLRSLIAESGLAQERFAREVMGRDPRTVRRWLAGAPIPESTLIWLSRIRSITVTRNAVTTVVDRHDRRGARRDWPWQKGTVAELEDVADDADVATDKDRTRAVGQPFTLTCACGLAFVDGGAGLWHALSCTL